MMRDGLLPSSSRADKMFAVLGYADDSAAYRRLLVVPTSSFELLPADAVKSSIF